MQNPFEIILQKLQALEAVQRELINTLKDTARKNSKEYLSISEASDMLNLSKKTIYNYCSRGILPHFKKNNKLVFERSKLLEWLTTEKDNSQNTKQPKPNQPQTQKKN